MPYRYVCSNAGFTCEVEYVDEDEEKVRNEAREHIRKDHPQEAIEQDKADALLLAGVRMV